jgi:hypothetical protein
VFRHINFAHATPDELEQLTQAGYCKAGKMDPEGFSSRLDPFRTDLIKIVRGYLLEGEESTKDIDIETYKLNIYSAHLIFIRPNLIFIILLSRQRLILQAPCRYSAEQKDVWVARDRLSNPS